MNIKLQQLDLKEFPSPRAYDDRKYSQFKAGWENTLSLLGYELTALGASGVVLRGGFKTRPARLDGWPQANTAASHPAVILSFRDAENRALSFPCDRYRTYEDNVRAIALSLEALRAVDRFGVTKRSEQYTGFKAIEAPKTWTIEDAAQFLAVKTGIMQVEIIAGDGIYRAAYRRAAMSLHPDSGGNPHEWKLLQDAKELLDQHHGIAKEKSA